MRSTTAVDSIWTILKKDSPWSNMVGMMFHSPQNIWIWELIHAWIVSQISEGWCPFTNAAARDVVGTCCHRTQCGWIHNINTVKVFWGGFFWLFSQPSRLCIPAETLTFDIVSFLMILPIDQYYVDRNQIYDITFNPHKNGSMLHFEGMTQRSM